MAGMDGLELAEALREAGHTMPIILLSQNTGHAEQDPGPRPCAGGSAKTRTRAAP